MAEEKKQTVSSDEISLKELILKIQGGYRYLRSKWLILLIAGIIGGALGLVYAMIKKPVYIATLTFALEEKSQGNSLGSYAGLASQFGINLGNTGGGVFSEDNMMILMKSRRMITQTLLSEINIKGKPESLADYYIHFNHLRDAWKKSSKVPDNISFPVNANPDSLSFVQDSLMGIFCDQITKKYLSIDKIDKNASIIGVTCKSPDELFAKYFTDALVSNVSKFYVQTKTSRATANVDILQSRLDSVKRAYTGALYSTAASTDQNMDPVLAIATVPRIRNQSNAQILGAEYAELAKNVEIAKMTLLQETPLVQVIDRPILPLRIEKFGKSDGIILGGLILSILTFIILLLISFFRDVLR
jgi:hypothetical protein